MAARLIDALVGSGRLSLIDAQRLLGPGVALPQQLDELSALGLPVRMEQDSLVWEATTPALSAIAIGKHLSASGRTCPVAVVMLTDSTNSRLLAAAAEGERSPRALLAECQTAGRGRQQRPWFGRYGEAIQLSILLHSGQPAARLPGLAIAAGVAIAECLTGLGVDRIRLKWPNDLLLDEAKLGGILIEAVSTPPVGMAVIGLGLNWRLSAPTLARIEQPAASLAPQLAANTVGRDTVAAGIIAALLAMAERFQREGLAPFLAAFDRFDALKGRPVNVLAPGGVRAGTALGLAGDGALRILHGDIEQSYRSAEVSVRRA